MRATALAALLLLSAGLAFAGAPATPAKSPKPAASPAGSAKPKATPKAPESGECAAFSAEDGSELARAESGDYQNCLRQVSSAIKPKICKEGMRTAPFVFHRGGQKPMATKVVCN